MVNYIHKGDIPADLAFSTSIAVDTETTGLKINRDRLCLLQLSSGNGDSHIVQFLDSYEAPRLKSLLKDPEILKIFHFARFDLGVIFKYLNTSCKSVYCTKIASKLSRTNTDRHGLKDLCRDLLSVELSKYYQSSDWASLELSKEQIDYAASDVLYLHGIKEILDKMLTREKRLHLAKACFNFLPHQAMLDVYGWEDQNIFAH